MEEAEATNQCVSRELGRPRSARYIIRNDLRRIEAFQVHEERHIFTFTWADFRLHLFASDHPNVVEMLRFMLRISAGVPVHIRKQVITVTAFAATASGWVLWDRHRSARRESLACCGLLS